RSKLYQLWAAGIGPRFMKVGVKVLISIEAAADWRREREQAAAEAAKAGMSRRPGWRRLCPRTIGRPPFRPSLIPHSPDNSLSLSAARGRRPWRTQGVNRNRMLFSSISTAA